MTSPTHYVTVATSVAGVAVSGFLFWFVRTILTDSKRLSLLEQRQELQHQEIVMAMNKTQAQVEEIRASAAVTVAAQMRIAEILDRHAPSEGGQE